MATISLTAEELQGRSLLDETSTFIVHAHAVKTSVAATEEALRSGSPLPRGGCCGAGRTGSGCPGGASGSRC